MIIIIILSWHLLKDLCASTVLSIIYILPHIITAAALLGRRCYYSHLIDEEQRG